MAFKNPYDPPAVDEDPIAAAPASGNYVVGGRRSKAERIANALIDQAVVLFTSVLAGLALGDDDFVLTLASCVGVFAYYVGFEATIGRTPGKLVTQTMVVSVSGEPPSFSQVLGRTLVHFVPFDALPFLGRRATGWHDRWSSTRVVRIGEPAPREQPARRRQRAERPRARTEPRVVRSNSDPSRRRVVCGVCGHKFAFGASACPKCETRYEYVAGRPVIVD